MTLVDRTSKAPIVMEVKQDLNIFRLEELAKLERYKKEQQKETEQFEEDQRILFAPTLADQEDVFYHVKRESAFRRHIQRQAANLRDNPQAGLFASTNGTDVEIARRIIGGKREEKLATGPFVY